MYNYLFSKNNMYNYLISYTFSYIYLFVFDISTLINNFVEILNCYMYVFLS